MPKRKKKTTNILSVLFFSIGALHIYSQIQRQSLTSANTTTWQINSYCLIGVLAALVAGIMEIITLVEF